MSVKKRIFGLKTIKCLFDVALVALVLFVALFLFVSVWDISKGGNKVVGFALIKENKADAIILDGDIESVIDGVEFSIKPDGIKVYYAVSSDEHKGVFVAWKIFYLMSLNLGLLFLFFVLYQIRNIINSVYRMTKSDNMPLRESVFSNKNILRLRYIAFGFIAMPLIELLSYYLDKLFLERYIRMDAVSVLPISGISSISWEYIFVGLLFIVMIGVFKKGVSLQEESDLTV